MPTMKPKTKFKIGDKVILPDGRTGFVMEESDIGELRVEGSTRTWWLYPEDLIAGDRADNTAQGEEQ